MAAKPIRQGDILLTLVEDAELRALVRRNGRPVKRVRGKGLVVAEGEATGHHHRVTTKGVKMYEQNGVLYLNVPSEAGAELVHEEHETLKIEKGLHRVTRNQREYEPTAPTRQSRVYD